MFYSTDHRQMISSPYSWTGLGGMKEVRDVGEKVAVSPHHQHQHSCQSELSTDVAGVVSRVDLHPRRSSIDCRMSAAGVPPNATQRAT